MVSITFLFQSAKRRAKELQPILPRTSCRLWSSQALSFFLEGLPNFTIFTEHIPLIGALHKKSDVHSPRQQRQLSFIAEFTSDIRHIKGMDNSMADMLSRTNFQITCMSDFDFMRVAKGQVLDESLQCLLNEWPHKFEKIKVNDTPVWCQIIEGPVVYVPESMQLDTFLRFHNCNHQGFKQTKRNIKKRFTWNKFHSNVKAMTQACVACARSKNHKTVPYFASGIPITKWLLWPRAYWRDRSTSTSVHWLQICLHNNRSLF